MKISTESLIGEPEKRVPVENAAPASRLPIPTFDNNLYASFYPPELVAEIVGYAHGFGFKLVNQLNHALEHRARMEPILSLREADICYRAKIDLSVGTVLRRILNDSNMLYFIHERIYEEGQPAYNIYERRKYFNKGVAFYKEGRYARASPEQKKKADDQFQKLKEELIAWNLPAYPFEEQNGFAPFLLRPEFLSDEQYQEARKSAPKFFTPAS